MIPAVFLLAGQLFAGAAPASTHGMMLADLWQNLTPRQRYEALRNFKEHESRPEDRQRDIEERYQRWQSLPDNERDRIRQNYERYRALPQPERDRFQRKYERWKQTSPPE